MERDLGKDNMKASESSPVPTKQVDDGSVRNQTTNVPKNRFPWVTIAVVLAFIILIAVVISFLEVGSN
ncbi:hypothetical protein [Costertonia aggregata]|uniref:Uncharacterized protein n=1 Tax=Costertonia aggregata TaxID=343403 RepID=A0A7H9ASS7_9FLAO|nr:hypothetical protein [Costertonia aggregata]QLG46486.1 hypothetical protein HYG79_14400 [Costertonia aggregata]